MELLIQVLLAHFIGDFALQSRKMVEQKNRRKIKSLQLYLHILIHTGLVICLTAAKLPMVFYITYALSHLSIDLIKIYNKRWSERLRFFLDQCLHIAVILALVLVFTTNNFNYQILLDEQLLTIALAAYFLTQPTSIALRLFFMKWNIDFEKMGVTPLENAGRYIGIIERWLIFIFILTNHWEAVGFLLTAKSVLRFGDLNKEKNMQLTEYVLIGTLLSFGTAIVIAMLTLHLIS